MNEHTLADGVEPEGASLLGVQSGQDNWLVDLAEAGEVLPPPAIAPVPLTEPWFLGLTCIRGILYGVADFSLFCGGLATPPGGESRLLLIGERFAAQSAILVNRTLGLVPAASLVPDAPGQPGPDWEGPTYHDAGGRRWRKLRVRQLLACPAFLDVAYREPGAPLPG